MARVEPLCRQRVKDLLPIFQEGFANKWLLGCCPCPTTLEEMEGTFRQYPDEKVALTALAVDESGDALGFITLAVSGLPSQLDFPMECCRHPVADGEVYIEQVAVSGVARGRGVGSALMGWAEDVARRRGARKMTLMVFKGNRAINLYEKFGMEKAEVSCTECFAITTLFGCPYGVGNCGAYHMSKVIKY
eukprot:CAMPEP_0182885106 /NCGR_PEP_ID=MMETSP0034_2-20130328/19406_1 /TAXON_ID=156128 /ORGANISM="Nephroselmis pyriformis, Strain CCMP717" /LENGTH=189 /DNA_ID=CAMNT_0025018355 /DNA_START=139 /DNA_END=708 /DNA_ORIENTATION=+